MTGVTDVSPKSQQGAPRGAPQECYGLLMDTCPADLPGQEREGGRPCQGRWKDRTSSCNVLGILCF